MNFNSKARDWGKVKFNPMKHKNFSEKARNWGKVKFDPMKQLAPSTPWSKFKSELKQVRPEANAKESENEKTFRKMREQNYRKTLIESKRNEPKTWENFENDEEEDKPIIKDPYAKKPASQECNLISKHTNKQNKRNPFSRDQSYGNESSLESKNEKKRKYNSFNSRNPFSSDERLVFKTEQDKNNISTAKRSRHLITEEDLKNFDSRNLTPEQNNHMRAVITKATTLKTTNLKNAIDNLKRRNELSLAKSKQSAPHAADE